MTTISLRNDVIDLIEKGGLSRQHAILSIYRNTALKDAVIKFVKNNKGNQEDGIDTFHDGIIALDLNIRKGKYRGEGDLDGYLYCICRFIWLNKMKKTKRTIYTDNQTELDDIVYENPESLSLKEEQKSILDQNSNRIGR